MALWSQAYSVVLPSVAQPRCYGQAVSKAYNII